MSKGSRPRPVDQEKYESNYEDIFRKKKDDVMKSYVCGFFFDQHDNVLLIQKVKPDWQKGKWNGIGGGIEEGETPIDAMVREFHEEAGITTRPQEWLPTIRLHGPEWEVFFFAAWGEQFVLKSPDIDEGHLEWVNSSFPPSNILPNLQWLLPYHSPKFHFRDTNHYLNETMETYSLGRNYHVH